jgi:CHAD domain-containing protein
MAHELSRSKDLAREVHRILLAQIDDACAELSRPRLSDKSIHQARKSLKKARATLRLVRASIPASVYRRENVALRDIARPLSAARDASVMVETLGKLERRYGRSAKESIPTAVRTALKQEAAEANRALGRPNGKQATSVKNLSSVKQRLARAPVTEDGWNGVGASLRRIYRNGRRAMKQAIDTPSAECLHEWRKQTKHLWHQTQVLEPLWPGMIAELGDQAHQLSDYLGDDHDLAVLRTKVTGLQDAFKHSGTCAALLALIDRCRTQLQEKAFLLGGRIYDESPAEFVTRFERYWNRWRKEKAERPPAGGTQYANPS